MAEYGREQRKLLGRAIANNMAGSRQLKGVTDNRTSYQKEIVQFLRTDITATDASNAVIEEMDEDDEHNWAIELLAGWGNAWIIGHSGDIDDEDRENVTSKAEDKEVGCHICGNNPGTISGKYIPDHQPPKVLASGGYTGRFRFYPHCLSCSSKQGAVVSEYKRRMKVLRNATDNDWASGIPGSLFWR